MQVENYCNRMGIITTKGSGFFQTKEWNLFVFDPLKKPGKLFLHLQFIKRK